MELRRSSKPKKAWSIWPFFWFTVVLLAKFIFARYLLFSQVNLLQGLWLEIGYILLVIGGIALLRWRPLKWSLFLIVNVLLSTFLFAVVIYYNYYGYIVTYHALSQLNQVGAVGDSVSSLIDPLYYVLFLDFLLLPLVVIGVRVFKKGPAVSPAPASRLFWLVPLLGFIVIASNMVMHYGDPIADTAVAAEKKGLVTYEILAFADGGAELAVSIQNKEDLLQAVQDVKDPNGEFAANTLPPNERQLFGAAEGRNIFVIQLEAFQNFAIGLEVDGKPITPVLNDLIKDSYYFSEFYQLVGQGNTSDAEFLLNTSFYPPAFKAASEYYSNKDLPSLPKLLEQQQGYQTMTFHANDVSFWSRDQMYPALGFDQYYDIDFFGEEDVIGIGPSDDVLYSKAVPEFAQKAESGEPIYANLITLSSHHPFRIPQSKNPLEMPEEIQGTIVEDYLQSLHYTDQMVGKFIQLLKDEGLWDNSMLVLYGDHFGLQQKAIEPEDIDAIDHVLGRPYTDVDRFNIPLIMSIPGVTDGGKQIEQTGGQIDIYPTIANLAGLNTEQQVLFGQDLLNTSSNLIGMRYYMPVGSFLNEDIMFRPLEGFSDGEAYSLETTEELDEFSQYKDDYERILKLMQLSDAYVDSLPEKF
ncbi:LTA synthase family protein [Aureibacillus halotolerans]|uniref:Phosphoglycerol transferase MdoB-like AlkP superfamily enzyme n=1 Tax=Aureibacillus halotolerans TaxID=1508390 RepID=A0A4R6TP43_9BACI|nr:LTA synthase family protein [Aureibacillus halotolerans]TDQ32176.1 phosphoglycerol transferase MdoB-like AlkP superfamily enzyme [Aureibacillus halotolerans]